jgi:hypothetical protein
MNWKRFGRRRPLTRWRYYSGICPEGLRKTTKNQDRRCHGRDSNRTPLKYESTALPLCLPTGCDCSDSSVLHAVQTASGAHPVSYTMGNRGLLKWPRREADRSLPSRTEVKNVWSFPSTPVYIFMEWCL